VSVSEVVKMYKEGYGIRQIANRLKLDWGEVVKILRAAELRGEV